MQWHHNNGNKKFHNNKITTKDLLQRHHCFDTSVVKDVPWEWTSDCQDAFEGIKQSLIQAPILALPDFYKPFSVVCDASKRQLDVV